jgi:hypothetical protein
MVSLSGILFGKGFDGLSLGSVFRAAILPVTETIGLDSTAELRADGLKEIADAKTASAGQSLLNNQEGQNAALAMKVYDSTVGAVVGKSEASLGNNMGKVLENLEAVSSGAAQAPKPPGASGP